MTVVGDGLQTRDYTNVSDVVDANIAAAICTDTKCAAKYKRKVLMTLSVPIYT